MKQKYRTKLAMKQQELDELHAQFAEYQRHFELKIEELQHQHLSELHQQQRSHEKMNQFQTQQHK